MESSFWTRAASDVPADRRVARAIATVIVSVVSLYVIYLLRTPILWLVLATLLAIAASGPVNLLAKRMKRGAAIAIVYLCFLLIPAAFGALLLPPLVTSAVDLVNDLPSYIHDFQNQLESNEMFRKLDENFDLNQQLNKAAKDLSGNLGDAAGTLGSIGSGIINSIFASFTILILSMFMVSRGRGWVEALIRRRPEHEAEVLARTASRVGNAVGGYIGGAIAQAFIAGVAAFIVLSILGVPSPLVLAAFVGALDVIPMVGSTIAGAIVGVVTLFADFPVDTIVWMIFVVGYQQFENYVVQPQIQRRAVELEPFIVLVAVLFGGTLMGVTGAVLAIPIAATIQIVVQEYGRFKRELRADHAVESTTPL